jgi:hypothetical protein
VKLVEVMRSLSTGRARSPWPGGRPGLAPKGQGPGQRLEGLAPNRRAKGQLDLEGRTGPNPGRSRTDSDSNLSKG